MSLQILLGNADISDQIITEEFDKTYVPLMKGLKSLDEGTIIETILKLKWVKQYTYDKDVDEVEDICEHHHIDADRCVSKRGTIDSNFKCICGKTHLKFLNMFNHTSLEERIIIGSMCLERLKVLSTLCGEHRELMDKIEEIMEAYGYAERKREYRRCWCCRRYEIKRDYDYVEPLHHHFCRNCLVKRRSRFYISCSRCKCEIKVCKTKDGKNWRLLCYKCWCRNNNITKK